MAAKRILDEMEPDQDLQRIGKSFRPRSFISSYDLIFLSILVLSDQFVKLKELICDGMCESGLTNLQLFSIDEQYNWRSFFGEFLAEHLYGLGTNA